MKLLCLRLLATSCVLFIAASAGAGSRPRYGGTARIVLRDRVTTIDPAADEDHPAARDRLASMLFETLVVVDEQGRLHPGLASAWSADAGKRVWQFRVRLAKFHDGSQVTAADVASSLTRASAPWKCTPADRQTVTIEASSPAPHIPAMLALEKFAIAKRQPDGNLVGTGLYKLSEWQPGDRALLTVNEDHWGGRAFPDAIEVQMATPLRELLLERQLGPYAAAELSLEQLRTLEQTNQDVLVSRPADLLVILFLQPDAAIGKPGRKVVDPRVREALANSLDRVTISNALLQRRSSPATGLLPQWLTGYEFLLPALSDRARARKLVTDTGLGARVAPIALAYDFSDLVAKAVAERIVVDAGQVGISVRTYGDAHINTKAGQASATADAVLLRLSLNSLEPAVALAATMSGLGLDGEHVAAALRSERPEDLFEIERGILENFRVIPVAHVSQPLWLNGNTHNWLQLPSGAWRLNELWVEGARPSVP